MTIIAFAFVADDLDDKWRINEKSAPRYWKTLKASKLESSFSGAQADA
jgi:hypothetical protein